jgi:hypothetical protein
MLQRVAICLTVLAALIVAPDAVARNYHHINPIPFSHSPCSVLDNRPCTPYFCSVFHHGPCIPEIDYPYGENLQLTVQTVPPKEDEAKYKRPDHDLDTIGDLFAELRSCWTPPPTDQAREGMQMSVRFSFKRSGELIGPPRLTFATAGASADEIQRRPRRRAGRPSPDGALCRQSRSRQHVVGEQVTENRHSGARGSRANPESPGWLACVPSSRFRVWPSRASPE